MVEECLRLGLLQNCTRSKEENNFLTEVDPTVQFTKCMRYFLRMLFSCGLEFQ